MKSKKNWKVRTEGKDMEAVMWRWGKRSKKEN